MDKIRDKIKDELEDCVEHNRPTTFIFDCFKIADDEKIEEKILPIIKEFDLIDSYMVHHGDLRLDLDKEYLSNLHQQLREKCRKEKAYQNAEYMQMKKF